MPGGCHREPAGACLVPASRNRWGDPTPASLGWMTSAAAITAFDVVFGVFVVGVVVLLALVIPFILRNGAAARRAWADAQRTLPDGAEAGSVPRPVTALVLGGGGTRGAVQVGMLQVLAEHGFVPDRIYGASVGAINGAGFAGDPTVEGVERITQVWRGIKSGDVYPQRLVHGPWQFLQQRPSVHPNTGLRKVVESGLTFERIEDARIPFAVVATSLVDGSERWLTSGPVAEAVLASAAIPAIFPPVDIDGHRLIDGGVVDNVPIGRAIRDGATRVVVLLCGPLEYEPPPVRRPVEVMLNALFIAVHARFAREVTSVPPEVDLVICSAGDTAPHDYTDFSDTDSLIAEGRAAALGILHQLGLGGPMHDGRPVPVHGGDEHRQMGAETSSSKDDADGLVRPGSTGRGSSVPDEPPTSGPAVGGPAGEPAGDAAANRLQGDRAPGRGIGTERSDDPVPASLSVRDVRRAVGRIRGLVDDARSRELLRSVPRSAQNLAARLPRIRIESGSPSAVPDKTGQPSGNGEGNSEGEGHLTSAAAPSSEHGGKPFAQPVEPPSSEGRSQPAPGR